MKSYKLYAWQGIKLGLALTLVLWNAKATLESIQSNSVLWTTLGLLATALCVQASVIYYQEIRRP